MMTINSALNLHWPTNYFPITKYRRSKQKDVLTLSLLAVALSVTTEIMAASDVPTAHPWDRFDAGLMSLESPCARAQSVLNDVLRRQQDLKMATPNSWITATKNSQQRACGAVITYSNGPLKALSTAYANLPTCLTANALRWAKSNMCALNETCRVYDELATRISSDTAVLLSRIKSEREILTCAQAQLQLEVRNRCDTTNSTQWSWTVNQPPMTIAGGLQLPAVSCTSFASLEPGSAGPTYRTALPDGYRVDAYQPDIPIHRLIGMDQDLHLAQLEGCAVLVPHDICP
jgi:hypothetical protein